MRTILLGLSDPVIGLKKPKTPERNLRGLKPPVYCHHCSRKITGRLYWIGKNPYCSYCYGFRAVLKEREKRKKMDEKTRTELKKQILEGKIG